MKTRTILISFILILTIPALSYGQVGNILKNRLNKAINKKVDEKIDTAIDRSVKDAQKAAEKETEQTEQTKEASKQGQGKGINLGGLMGGKVTARYNESYSFNSRIWMTMEMYDKKDVVKMDFNMYFSENSPNGGFESKMLAEAEGEQVPVTTTSIFDGENKVFLLLTDMGAMKMGIISEVPDETTVQNQPVEETRKPIITKTGNTRIIAGYKCDEYLLKDNETKETGRIWATKDLKLQGDSRIYSKTGLPSYYSNSELKGSAVLAMEIFNEKNEPVMKSETKEINMNFPKTLSAAGYSLRQMNFNQAGAQQKK